VPEKPKIAILGGGMGGLSAAWRLSEPGWHERFGSITVYQRGWRLGGKGASSRGVHGRIEEHGLHVWLGHYDNAFRLMRDCYDAVDRAHTDPTAPIRTWRDAFKPASDIGIVDHHDGVWRPWIGHFAENDRVPGDADDGAATWAPGEILRRVARLLRDLVESFEPVEPVPVLSTSPVASVPRRLSQPAAAVLAAGAMVEGLSLASGPVTERAGIEAVAALDLALAEVRDVVSATTTEVWGARQGWQVIGMIAAVVRGSIADGVLQDPGGSRRLNDEEFLDWIRRHGASDAMVESTYVRGLYDLVFGHAGGDPERRGFGAGLGAMLSVKTMLDYKGAFFWKMTAGMGDVVFAPLYEALRQRGVDFEFFHRVDALHLADDGLTIDAITMGRQAGLAEGCERYEPLVRVKGLPCFPAEPLVEQLACGDAVAGEALESAWCTWPDAETRRLQRGVDFDHVVFAIPPPMAAQVCRELVEANREWRDMVANIATVATQSLQLWLRESERDLGWPEAGATMTGYVDGFDTWASMPQLLAVEDWPADDRPESIAYFCNTFESAWPPEGEWQAFAASETSRVRATAQRFCENDLAVLLPGAVSGDGFRWDLLCGAGAGDASALDSQFWRANIDPSDRYVQSLPGTDRFRLRSDESGFENLVLAGDWTDSGLNAGCIEAAVLSGLQAANALLGRHRFHRIIGAWLV
jgi:uncharacterized protein with NAD-binding domain and iron-sulfur cluster